MGDEALAVAREAQNEWRAENMRQMIIDEVVEEHVRLTIQTALDDETHRKTMSAFLDTLIDDEVNNVSQDIIVDTIVDIAMTNTVSQTVQGMSNRAAEEEALTVEAVAVVESFLVEKMLIHAMEDAVDDIVDNAVHQATEIVVDTTVYDGFWEGRSNPSITT